jgi:acyl carrier protein
MDKKQIFEMLLNNLQETIPDLADTKVELHQTMAEIGANSLDVVEVVSTTMREVKVRLPRETLQDLANVGALVDALHDAQGE